MIKDGFNCFAQNGFAFIFNSVKICQIYSIHVIRVHDIRLFYFNLTSRLLFKGNTPFRDAGNDFGFPEIRIKITLVIHML